MGMVIGTVAYMAPEQARGEGVDKRADIWSFGCVLMEMLTGRRVFEERTVSDTLASVLKVEPRWETLPASLPPSVRRLLMQSLEKAPKRRLRDIGDGLLQLEDPEAGYPDAAAPPRFNAFARAGHRGAAAR